MKILSEVFKIECEKPTLKFLKSWFEKNNIDPVRFAIVEVENNVITLDVAYQID